MRTIRLTVGLLTALGMVAPIASAATIEGGVAGLKLILLDKYSLNKAKAVYVAKGDPDIQQGAAGDPPGLTGTVEIVQLSDPTNKAVYDLPSGGWLVNKATVAKYVDKTAAPGGAGAKVVVVKPSLVGKVVAKNLGDGDSASGDQSANDLNLQAITTSDTLRVIVTINNANDSNTYVFCSDFDTLSIKNDLSNQPFKVISKSSTAPATCAVAPTTTTTSTTTTSTSTTTLPCTCSSTVSTLTFTNSLGVGNCGTTTNTSGTVIHNLACNMLYIGGGGSAQPAAINPDLGTQVYNAVCSANQLLLSKTTPADTGSIRDCTEAGCLFGAPLAIINPTEPLSTCVINVVAQDTAGVATCDTGEADISLPLTSVVRLAGDILAETGGCVGGPTPGAACSQDSDCGLGGQCGGCIGGPTPGAACSAHSACGDGGYCSRGTQPCPVCTADSTSGTGYRCRGGTNNGGTCMPATTEYGLQAPTSHDCPPSQVVLGNLPIPFQLTTGTASKTAVDMDDVRTFCGFCRNGTSLLFENPPRPCTTNVDCTNPSFESCQQRQRGAFGNESVRTISETGTPAGDLNDNLAHTGTLATVFCIPPTFNGAIDAVANLPGPGATTLPGTLTMNP